MFLDFIVGTTYVKIQGVDEGSESIANCVTGSLFYSDIENETEVKWLLFSNSSPPNILTRHSPPIRSTESQPNKSFFIVSTYKANATRGLNWKRLACRLNFKGTLQVESQSEPLIVYCMVLIYQIVLNGFTFKNY